MRCFEIKSQRQKNTKKSDLIFNATWNKVASEIFQQWTKVIFN